MLKMPTLSSSALFLSLALLASARLYADVPGTSDSDVEGHVITPPELEISTDGDIKSRKGKIEVSAGYAHREGEGEQSENFSAEVSTDYKIILGTDGSNDTRGYDGEYNPGYYTLGFRIGPRINAAIEAGPDANGDPQIQRLRVDMRPFTIFEYQYMYENPHSEFNRATGEVASASSRFHAAYATKEATEKAIVEAPAKIEALKAAVALAEAEFLSKGKDTYRYDKTDRQKAHEALGLEEELLANNRKQLPELQSAIHVAFAALNAAQADLEKVRQTYKATIELRVGELGYLHTQDAMLGISEDMATAGVEFIFHKAYKINSTVDFDLCGALRPGGIAVGQQTETNPDNTIKRRIRLAWNPSANLCMGMGSSTVGHITVNVGASGRIWTSPVSSADYADLNAITHVDLTYDAIGGSPVSIYGRYDNATVGRAHQDTPTTSSYSTKEVNTVTTGISVKF